MKMGLQHFSELDSAEQAIKFFGIRKCPFNRREIQSDEDEVNLLNTLRDSDMTSEEFINSLVDYRMQAVSAKRTEHYRL
jgi:hypothetical protein